MKKINSRLHELEREDIFANVSSRIIKYKKANPDKKIISLGIGDVSKPVIDPIIKAMHKAVDDLSNMETFKGYGAYYGYDFLKEKILNYDYNSFNFSKEEIYISNGTKTDTTSILELFDIDCKICVTNPMYPIYKDGATCLNRKITELNLNEENNFFPDIPKEHFDLIYICSPSNPIGIAYTYDELKKWVDYALENDSVILYDNVYNSFITSENVPNSIYEIPNAKNVAIEFRSYSKNASFSGTRCSYYVIPNEISPGINRMWRNRTINRFNGSDYIVQRGAEAIYSTHALEMIDTNIKDYLNNSNYLREAFMNLGFKVWGGVDSPFMWVKINNEMNSWEFFEFMLEKFNIVIIPGCIFGSMGNKYFRVSALGLRNDIDDAIKRLRGYYEK